MMETIGSSLIQHGKYNDRVYLMKYKPDPDVDMVQILDALVKENRYTKVFAKIPEKHLSVFHDTQYEEEARIPNYFLDDDDCLFLSRYFSSERSVLTHKAQIADTLALCEKQKGKPSASTGHLFALRKAGMNDAPLLAGLYKQVFDSYPFPIMEPDYIRRTMRENIEYFIVQEGDVIVAASSAEKDMETRSVEMTDFATLPTYRRKGIANQLLAHMEGAMREQRLKTAYTIARALSVGMNLTFAKNQYAYGGTLINNTYIAGSIESMNVWYKHL